MAVDCFYLSDLSVSQGVGSRSVSLEAGCYPLRSRVRRGFPLTSRAPCATSLWRDRRPAISQESATSWARMALAAKNQLTTNRCEPLEDAFERLSSG
jgi:hypothetical protein